MNVELLARVSSISARYAGLSETSKVVLLLLAIMLIFLIFMVRRNNAVYAYRLYLIEQFHLASQADIAQHRDYTWRRKVFYTVSYHEMVYKFWKPLHSFYPNKDFLDPKVQYGEL